MMREIVTSDLDNIYSRKEIPWESLRDSSVLITGAYGMLASYVMFMLIFLNEKFGMNIRILAMSRSFEKFKKRFGEYAGRSYIRFISSTIEKDILIEDDIDFIIHAASYASPKYYGVCPVDVLKPNVIGNYHLLELAVRKKIKGYLLFSTGDIYGVIRGKKNIYESDLGFIDSLDIHSCYSESKRMAETMCYSYYHQYNVPVKILRIWHTYAPTMDVKNDPRVFASFINDVVHGHDIVMKSNGMQKRTFCYIADAVAGFFLVLLKGNSGEAYNICNTEEFLSIKDLAETIISIKHESEIKIVSKKRSVNEDYTENTAIGDALPSNSKLKALGWNPQFTVKDGFKRIIKALEQENRGSD